MSALSSEVRYLPIFLITFAIPFFFAGLVIASAFNAFAHMANRLYFADLFGASLGSLLAAGSLTLMGGEDTVLLVSTFSTISALVFAFTARNRKIVAIGIMLFMLSSATIAVNAATHALSISTHATSKKDLPLYLAEHPEARLVRLLWNSFSRVDVVEGAWEMRVWLPRYL